MAIVPKVQPKLRMWNGMPHKFVSLTTTRFVTFNSNIHIWSVPKWIVPNMKIKHDKYDLICINPSNPIKGCCWDITLVIYVKMSFPMSIVVVPYWNWVVWQILVYRMVPPFYDHFYHWKNHASLTILICLAYPISRIQHPCGVHVENYEPSYYPSYRICMVLVVWIIWPTWHIKVMTLLYSWRNPLSIPWHPLSCRVKWDCHSIVCQERVLRFGNWY